MATRRIARGRGASPVPIIVLSVLLVGLLAATIVLAVQVNKTETERDGAVAKKGETDLALRKLEQRREDYKALVGLNLDGASTQLAQLNKEWEGKAPIKRLDGGEEATATPPFKTLVAITNAYVERTQSLEANVKSIETELEKSKAERTRLEKEIKTKEEEAQAELAKEKKRGDDLDTAKNKVETDLAAVRKDLATQIDTAKNEKVELTKELSAAKKEAEVLRKKIKELERRLKDFEYAKTIGPLIHPTSAPGVVGRVVSVDPDGQHVMIDLGRQDWVEQGMEFRVYDQADPDARKDKGLIQVRKVFEGISQAKVLKQDAVDPILPHMVLVNPAFSRGKRLEFVFEGRLKDPNLVRALERYPCHVAKDVSEKTDYLVIGEGERKPTDVSPEDSENYKKATSDRYKRSCVVMRERELARYLGELE